MVSILLFLAAATTASAASNSAATSSPATAPKSDVVMVQCGGNSYVTTQVSGGSEAINDSGLHGWTSPKAVISTFVLITQPGSLNLALRSTPTAKSKIKVTVAGKTFPINLNAGNTQPVPIGTVTVPVGYLRIDLQGEGKPAQGYGDVQGFDLSGPAAQGAIFANDSPNFYWSRRGPSVHMSYKVPAKTEYFYNEVMVPEGKDPIGSYFMTNGFGEGYFGIQVNSATERRILFSVWNPSEGKTTMVKTGNGVIAKNFGGEGTGGQSYLIYPWKAGVSYPHIIKIKPDGKGNTLYSAWFYAVEQKSWLFIATWLRPNTNKWVTNTYSFAENFLDAKGYLEREAQFGPQWAVNQNGQWTELLNATFTVDGTGGNKQRLDFAGGVSKNKFWLRNGAFFDATVKPNQGFSREGNGQAPKVDLKNLP